MNPVQVTIRGLDLAPYTIPAWDIGVPGLVVHRVPNRDRVLSETLWSVTHVRSGCTLRAFAENPEQVVALALEIGALTDWTQPATALTFDSGLRDAIKAACARHGGEYRSDLRHNPDSWADVA